MKKISIFLMTTMILGCLTGCGQTPANQGQTVLSDEQEKTVEQGTETTRQENETKEQETESTTETETSKSEESEFDKVLHRIYQDILDENMSDVKACLNENGELLVQNMKETDWGYDLEKSFSIDKTSETYGADAFGYNGMIGSCIEETDNKGAVFYRFEFGVCDYTKGYADGKGIRLSTTYNPSRDEKASSFIDLTYVTMENGMISPDVEVVSYYDGAVERTTNVQKIAEGDAVYQYTLTAASGSAVQMNFNAEGNIIFDDLIDDIRMNNPVSFAEMSSGLTDVNPNSVVLFNYLDDKNAEQEYIYIFLDGEVAMGMGSVYFQDDVVYKLVYKTIEQYKAFGGKLQR